MRHRVHHLIYRQGEPHAGKVDDAEEHCTRSPQPGPSSHDPLLISREPYASDESKVTLFARLHDVAFHDEAALGGVANYRLPLLRLALRASVADSASLQNCRSPITFTTCPLLARRRISSSFVPPSA